MKTTIDIATSLLEEARKVAAAEGTTVRALVEEGLHRALAARKSARKPFKLKLVTVRGGLAPGVPEELPRELAYDLDLGSGR